MAEPLLELGAALFIIYIMSKKMLKGRTQFKNNVGKLYGRSSGPMVYNEHVGCLVTPKINEAINRNQKNG
jgi:hypothetical protein